MIFVTVGAQMPFDRLVKTVDDWVGETGREDVFAQIGPTGVEPNHIQWTRFLNSEEFFEKFESADVIVAHAGMGTILSALQKKKPILVMPRRADLRETRNDHQVATANKLHELGNVEVAFDENELAAKLRRIDHLDQPKPIGQFASTELIQAIREFIAQS